MDYTESFPPGRAREDHYPVAEEHTAVHVGSGSLRVLATPWLIAFMERTARLLLAEDLPAGTSSVGVRVEMRHLAATPVGGEVRTRAEVLSVEGRTVNFSIQAWDDQELVGEGQHQRVIIDEERFLKRVNAKLAGGSK
jgi:predicted thioesterase